MQESQQLYEVGLEFGGGMGEEGGVDRLELLVAGLHPQELDLFGGKFYAIGDRKRKYFEH